jgi:uncharacterized DUF497 family protein
MALVISNEILHKLTDKHGVSKREVEQCFENRDGGLLEDSREDHKTNPPTQWFIAMTNKQRLLKIVFVQDGANTFLKTAFEPNSIEIGIYQKHG